MLLITISNKKAIPGISATALSTGFDQPEASFFSTGTTTYTRNNPDIAKNITERKHINPSIFPQFHISTL